MNNLGQIRYICKECIFKFSKQSMKSLFYNIIIDFFLFSPIGMYSARI